MSNITRRPIYAKGAKPVKAPALRNAARDQTCTLRLDCCNGDPSTVVLAHLRCFGWGGMGDKPHDFLAVFACSDCHDALDRRVTDASWGWDDITRALGETLIRQWEAGNLNIGENL